MSETRRFYRTSPPLGKVLSVAVVTLEGEYPGEIIDLSMGGVGVFLDRPLDPTCQPGGRAQLKLTSLYLGEPFLETAVLRHHGTVESGHFYGFEFVDAIGLLSRLPRGLSTLFNKRHISRLEPDTEEPVQVQVEDLDRSRFEIWENVHDISTEGFSFKSAAMAELFLAGVEYVHASFCFPGAEPLAFVAKIRHQFRGSDWIRYGASFDGERTEDFAEKKAVLAEYLHGPSSDNVDDKDLQLASEA